MKIHMDSTDRQTYAAAIDVLRHGGDLRAVIQRGRTQNERQKAATIKIQASSKKLAKSLAQAR